MPPPKVAVIESWPQPSSSPEPAVYGTDSSLALRYIAADDRVAIVHFPSVKCFQLGAPNDEALGGHPLAAFGLKYYSVHLIENSPWISELERRNSVHPRHESSRFLANLCHYVFTFQDSTFECVVRQDEWSQPVISRPATEDECRSSWLKLISDLQP